MVGKEEFEREVGPNDIQWLGVYPAVVRPSERFPSKGDKAYCVLGVEGAKYRSSEITEKSEMGKRKDD